MIRVSSRLADLDAISRARLLTRDEQAEVIRLAVQHRRNETRRNRYRADPEYRLRRLGVAT
jgi:hypothetical protein